MSSRLNLSKTALAILPLTALMFGGCAVKESHRVITAQQVASHKTVYNGPKSTLVVGNFDNRSNYMQGLFSDNQSRVSNQAKTILKTHLQQSNRFKLMDRENLAQIEQEASFRGQKQNIKGARYAVSGAVTEFGRKEVGDVQLFGILGAGKQQVAYSKVSMTIVDVLTSEIIYSTQGAGEYALSQREVLGFGTKAGYDSTLTGKVLNLSIMEAVNNLVRDIENGTIKLDK